MNNIMLKTMGLLVCGMFLCSVGMVSADLVILGTIYDGSAGGDSQLNGASVNVVCGITSSPVFVTKTDGAYAVLFNDSECNESHNWSISVSKSGYKSFNGDEKAVDYSDNMTNFSGLLYSTVIDFVLEKEEVTDRRRGSGGSSRCNVRLWDCELEWSECVNGSQNRTCNSNCGTEKVEMRLCTVEEEVKNEMVLEDNEGEAEVSEPSGFFSTITGAVIGGGTKSLGIGVGVLIVVVVGLFVVVRKRKG